MLMDERNTFADGVNPTVGPGGSALTATAGATTLFGDILPLGSARDLGTGKPLWLVVIAATALSAVSTTPSTFAFHLNTGSASSGGSITTGLTTIQSSQYRAAPSNAAPIPAGTVLWMVPLLPETYQLAYSSLLQLSNATGAAAALAAGCRVRAFLTSDISRWKALADAVN